MKMKILQIIPSLNAVGGAENFVIQLSAALQQIGQEVTILSLYPKKNDFFDQIIINKDLKVLYLNKKRGIDFKTARELIKTIRKINPDVIHGHLHFHLTLMLGMRYKIKRIPFVETFHQNFENATMNIILKKYATRLYNNKMIVPVAISDEVKRTAVEYFNISNEVPVIYNGITIQELNSNNPINSRENEFISVSRLSHVKNHYLMIEAIDQLVQKGYNSKLTIIGDGELFLKLNKAVKEKKLEKNIFLIGEKKNVFDYLITHKYFLLPSFSEGNPLSLLEAMSCGLVPIVTKIGGAKDIVTDKNGYVIDPYDAATLMKAMENVINDPFKNELFSKFNFENSKKFNISNTAREYLELYKKMMTNVLKKKTYNVKF